MYQGLTKVEVLAKRAEFGKNELPQPKFRFLRLLARQFKSIFIVLLLVAALVTFMLGEPFDATFILVFVFLGVALSLYQEYKSNATADKLQSYLVRTVTVRRDNVDVELPISELVPGDILKLESGEVIPADAVVRFASGLQVDETTFTGESIPVSKVTQEGGKSSEASTLLQGTVVVRGLAYAEVTATGQNTRLAKVAHTVSTIETVSDLTKGVDRISMFILRATTITLVFVIVANIFIDGAKADIPHLLIFAIALAISVIPEALPLVITFSLSHGALRLAKESVIVKRLSSVQDLGSIELLCTDKTGTITENKLVYQNDYLVPGCPWHPLTLSRLTAHDLNESHPEPFDQATNEALGEEQCAIVGKYVLEEEEPFDPALRSNGAKVRHEDGSLLHIRRGSPEYFITQGLVKQSEVEGWLRDEEAQGRRVLGVGYDAGEGMRFGGFVSFADTLKPSTEKTLQQARDLNVAVTIVTGDSLLVAEAIGRQVGLVASAEEVIEAEDFFALPATEQYRKMGMIRVFARTTPEQKLSLITLLKERYTVGFLGEGINDAAALRAANVSLVVQSASDVARETADIVLLKSNLGVIVEGIKLGRETHANTLKYIRATLISNFGNFYSVAMASLFITFLPMLPKQLLLLNLLSDFPMMAIAFDRVSKSEITRPQKYDFRSLYIIFITLGLVSTIFDFMWFGLFYREGAEVLQTNWFIGSVLTEILLLFSIRSLLPVWKSGRPAPVLIGLTAFAFVATVALPMIPVAAHYFEFTTPSLGDLSLIVIVAFIYIAVTEAVKRPLARFLEKRSA
ncbi:MAG: HAD-IC family P-type ATPase [Candidatus Pacebacteria bacterium]|nr:HAD-IC family P-type ATPase [Candidatus Paceibacterota bacterium]